MDPRGSAAIQTLHFADVDELSDAVPRADVRYVQVAPGRAPGRVTRVQAAGVSLLNIFMSNHTLAHAVGDESRQYYVVVPTRWQGDLYWDGRRVAQQSIMAWGHDSTYLRRGRDLELFVLMYEQHEFLDAAAAWTGREPSRWRLQHGEPRPLTGAALRLPGSLHTVLASLEEHPEALATPDARQSLADALTGEIIDAHAAVGFAGAAPARSLLSRSRIVHRADEYLRTQLDRHVSKLDLCRAIGASARSVDYAFRDVCGMSMGRYLKVHRLRRARQLLRHGTPNIANVKQCAIAAGFLQLGRFAVDYRRFFGETPSATLARATGPGDGPPTVHHEQVSMGDSGAPQASHRPESGKSDGAHHRRPMAAPPRGKRHGPESNPAPGLACRQPGRRRSLG